MGSKKEVRLLNRPEEAFSHPDVKTMEENLRESEQRVRAIFESAAIGIVWADLEGRWLEINPALEECSATVRKKCAISLL